METARYRDLEIAYQRHGEGPVLVLLHGGLSDSREWRRQSNRLSDEFTVVAWDAPASGKSSDPEGEFTLSDFADAVAGVVEILDLGPAVVAGNSWGGTLALEFHHRHPELIRALILCDTYAGWIGSIGTAAAQERFEGSKAQWETQAPEEYIPGWLPGLLTENAPQELFDEIAATMLELRPAGFRLQIESMMTDLRGYLPEIDVPTLLIWGEQDARSPLTIAEEFKAAIPNAQLVVIPSAGHMTHVEQPERFNDAVREFCRSLG